MSVTHFHATTPGKSRGAAAPLLCISIFNSVNSSSMFFIHNGAVQKHERGAAKPLSVDMPSHREYLHTDFYIESL